MALRACWLGYAPRVFSLLRWILIDWAGRGYFLVRLAQLLNYPQTLMAKILIADDEAPVLEMVRRVLVLDVMRSSQRVFAPKLSDERARSALTLDDFNRGEDCVQLWPVVMEVRRDDALAVARASSDRWETLC